MSLAGRVMWGVYHSVITTLMWWYQLLLYTQLEKSMAIGQWRPQQKEWGCWVRWSGFWSPGVLGSSGIYYMCRNMSDVYKNWRWRILRFQSVWLPSWWAATLYLFGNLFSTYWVLVRSAWIGDADVLIRIRKNIYQEERIGKELEKYT